MAAALTTFEPDTPAAEIATTLRADGGVIIKNLVSEELMDKVYGEVNRNTTDAQQKTGGGNLWPDGNRTVGALGAVSPTYTENLLLHPKVLEVADAILLPKRPMAPNAGRPSDDKKMKKKEQKEEKKSQDPYESPLSNVVKNEAGERQAVNLTTDSTTGPNCHHYNLGAGVMLEVHRGSKNQILHRERAIYQPYIGKLTEMPEFIVSVNWSGTDFTLENGATRVVPGSHQWPEERIAQEEEIAQAVMPKGSALIWLSRTLHGAAANHTKSDQGRTAFFGSYVIDWLTPEENQYLAVPPEVAQKLSPRAQQILGYRCSPSCGWVKGREQDHSLLEGQSSPL